MMLKLGNIVNYHTDDYTVPAMVTCTTETINEQRVELFSTTYGAKGIPPLSNDNNVHLMVFSPEVGVRHDNDLVNARLDLFNPCYPVWDVPEGDGPGHWSR